MLHPPRARRHASAAARHRHVPMPYWLLHLRARALVELKLQRKLDVIGVRTVLVVVECVIQDREDALWRDRVGRVGQHCAQHKRERINAFTFLILADILILLISYWFYTDFGNLARNTGFVLSTVIIRVAISSKGVSAMVLFTLSGLLGIAILRMFDTNIPSRSSQVGK